MSIYFKSLIERNPLIFFIIVFFVSSSGGYGGSFFGGDDALREEVATQKAQLVEIKDDFNNYRIKVAEETANFRAKINAYIEMETERNELLNDLLRELRSK